MLANAVHASIIAMQELPPMKAKRGPSRETTRGARFVLKHMTPMSRESTKKPVLPGRMLVNMFCIAKYEPKARLKLMETWRMYEGGASTHAGGPSVAIVSV